MITERHEKNSRTKILLYVLLGVAVLGGGWVVYMQFADSPEVVTVGSVTSAPRPRNTPSVNTKIFSDERLMGDELTTGLQFTNQAAVTPFDENLPPPPTNIEVRNPSEGRRLLVVWDKAAEGAVDGVNIYRMLSEVDTPTLIGTVSADVKLFDDRTVVDGRTYYYLVKTFLKTSDDPQVAEIVESQNVTRVSGSSTDTIPPNPPSNVTVTNIGNGTSAEISWVNPTNSDFAFIRIYRSTVEGDIGQPLTTTASLTGTSFTDTTVSSGVTYYYTVTAVDESGNESLGTLFGTPGRPNPFLPPS